MICPAPRPNGWRSVSLTAQGHLPCWLLLASAQARQTFFTSSHHICFAEFSTSEIFSKENHHS